MVQAAARAVAACAAGEAGGQRVAMEVRAGLWAAAWAPCPEYRGVSVGGTAALGVGGRSAATEVARVARAEEWADSNPGSIRRTRSLIGRGNLGVVTRWIGHFRQAWPHRCSLSCGPPWVAQPLVPSAWRSLEPRARPRRPVGRGVERRHV